VRVRACMHACVCEPAVAMCWCNLLMWCPGLGPEFISPLPPPAFLSQPTTSQVFPTFLTYVKLNYLFYFIHYWHFILIQTNNRMCLNDNNSQSVITLEVGVARDYKIS